MVYRSITGRCVYTGIRAYRCPGIQAYWYTGSCRTCILAYMHTGVLAHWCIDVLAYRCIGMYWCTVTVPKTSVYKNAQTCTLHIHKTTMGIVNVCNSSDARVILDKLVVVGLSRISDLILKGVYVLN